MTEEEAIKLWVENKVVRCEMPFTCGGDSMNDLEVELYDKDNNTIDCVELQDYFNDVVYQVVDFYVNSDGHYLGEFGTVEVALIDDEFAYTKCASSEYCELLTGVAEIELTEDENKFISENVENINGNDNNVVINYKRDIILTDTLLELISNFKTKVVHEIEEYDFKSEYSDSGDERQFTTNDIEFTELTIIDGKLQVEISASVIVVRD